METLLPQKIESLRYEMIDMAQAYGSLTHEKVVHVSQQLDKYIYAYQKMQHRNR